MILAPQKMWTFSLAKERNVAGRTPLFFGGQALHAMHYDKGGFSESLLFSIDLGSGLENWRFKDPHVLNSPKANQAGDIFISSFSGRVISLDRAGQIRWETPVTKRNLWDVALAGEDRLIVAEIAGQSSATWCLSQTTGEVLWRFENGGHSYPIAVDRGIAIHATTQQGKDIFDGSVRLLAIDIATGNLKWSTHSSEYLFVPHIAEDVVFIGGNGSIRAYGLNDGTLLARYEFGEAATFNRGIAVFGSALIVSPDESANLHALEYQRKRGLFRTSYGFNQRWSRRFSSNIVGSAGSVGGNFFVALENGSLAVFDDASGKAAEIPNLRAGAGQAVRESQLLTASGRTLSLVEFGAGPAEPLT